MLTRRNLFKFAATFGLGVFAPRFEQLASGAAVESRQGQDPSPERVLSQHEQSFLDLEWFENLKDDLDCVEVVAYVAPTFNMPASAEINLIREVPIVSFVARPVFAWERNPSRASGAMRRDPRLSCMPKLKDCRMRERRRALKHC